VWVNGQFAGVRPYGFESFALDVTPFVRFGSTNNVMAVRVDHSRFADSRFYTGSGIYRNVRLCLTDKIHIAHWGVSVTTPRIKADSATVHVETTVENQLFDNKKYSLQSDLLAPDGQVVASRTSAGSGATGGARVVIQDLKVSAPQLWSIETPVLYTLRSRVMLGTNVADETLTPFGIRTTMFDADKGFLLNGASLKFKGVCLHHDAGPLGAAVPDQVLERRLRELKEIGVNAIRTSHNPPDPALLDQCDRMGFLVMDEAFDEFTPGKNKWVSGRNSGQPSHFGYADLFAEWSVRDMQDLVRRDRNHPSIVLWSIGNEVDFANDPFSDPALGKDYHPENPSAKILVTGAKPLIAAVKSLDRTRPVTAALATVSMSDAVGLADLLDADGYNYQEARYADDHRKYPHRIIYGSENSQQYNAWLAVRDNDYIAGQFLWTGVDYLGEANAWPNRASGAGLFDLCGFKKPMAWFRQSLWSSAPMVYICASSGNGPGGRRGFGGAESWNWPSNSTVNVLCFANCPEVSLALNGQIIGTKKLSEAVRGMLIWRVPYAPGTLEAIGQSNGVELCRYSLKTAGAPARIELLPDVTRLRANGKDVSQVEFRIVDAGGVRISDVNADVQFEISGPGNIIGIGNGDVNSTEDCKANHHHTFQGRGLAIVQTGAMPGTITLKATAPGLEAASAMLQSQ
jgi:beta-galactosidase